MNKRYQRMAGLALVLLLAGCASVNPWAGKKQDYHDARLGRPLEVPPDLTQLQVAPAYTIPAQTAPVAVAPAVPQPPAVAQPTPGSAAAVAPAVTAAPPAAPAPVVTATPPNAPAPAVTVAPAAAPVIAHAVLTQTSGGAGMLLLNEPLEQAWRRVGVALVKARATIEDRNWSQGIYYVHGVPARTSFWRFWQHRDPAAGQLWRVRLAPHGAFIGVTVLDDSGQPSATPTANRLIQALYQQLK